MKKPIVLIFLTLLFGNSSASSFGWNEALLASMKLQEDYAYERTVDSYMRLFRRDVWTRHRNDEFELQDKRVETVEIMKDRVDNLDLNSEFLVNTEFRFLEYDFEKSEYPLIALNEDSIIRIEHVAHRSHHVSTYGLPTSFDLSFTNTDIIGAIPMKQDVAREFLISRRDSRGNVNRALSVALYFKLIDFHENDNRFDAEITRVDIFHGPLRDRGSVIKSFRTEKRG